MSGIYGVSVDMAGFETFCGGNLQGEHESCVELAVIPSAGPAYALRDSKPEGVGRELRFTETELDDFVRGYARRRGLKL
ncbi:DUF397 domain-containing protein [Streptomyces sp. L2]|uniref:DUF397 domain-containing protein n=1 Tax=Streptomyces sp. L2 TaxID=2162665 RepID=UPI001013AFBB|nr:DUF397 domain-containing protein [Streptomyces sp. L2]